MSLDRLSAQDLLSRFSYQNEHVLLNMIRIENPPKTPAARRAPNSSTLGLLNSLPSEILHLVLHNLDLRSLSPFSRVSGHGYTVVQSLSAYRDLLQHAPHAMMALGRTGSIRWHTLEALHATLCSQKCASCGSFGAFLFLPTCERCCYACLSRNQSFWVTSPALARKCFGLDQHQIKNLPVIRSLLGVYEVGIRGHVSCNRRRNLVSVRSAKALGVKVHGSTMNMPDWQALCQLITLSTKEWRENSYLRWLQKASIHLQKDDSVMLPFDDRMPKDIFCGMASIPFPSLVNGEVDCGVWCRGCEAMTYKLNFYNQREIERALGISIDPKTVRVKHIVIGLQHSAKSKSEFLTHAKHCHGVRKLVSGAWKSRIV